MAQANPNLSLINQFGLTECEAFDLEGLIDRRGIEPVLQQIAGICGEKAQHIAEYWIDARTALRWATVESAVGAASTKAAGL
jgi:hypothetical protein